MVRLYLLRHAKSAWGNGAHDDFDRPLNRRGRTAAPAMGKHMRRLGIATDLILCSAALRARETLALLLPLWEQDAVIRIERALYLADAPSLLDRLRAVDRDSASVLLIGHNPGLQDLAQMLAISDDTPSHRALRSKFPTAALAELSFDANGWADLAPNAGELVRFVTPRSLPTQDRP